jgi:hypothetical protein
MSIRRACRGIPMALALTSATWFAIPAFSLPADLEGEVSAVKAENAALREQLRKIEDQQRALMELITQLQKRLDGAQIADAPRAAPPPVPTQISDFSVPFTGAAPFSKPFTARPSSLSTADAGHAGNGLAPGSTGRSRQGRIRSRGNGRRLRRHRVKRRSRNRSEGDTAIWRSTRRGSSPMFSDGTTPSRGSTDR